MIREAARLLVDARDEGRCMSCGGPANNRHHRRFKGMGGSSLTDKDSAQNLATLCGSGNTGGCHGRAHTDNDWALSTGYRVAPGVDPLTVPVEHYRWGLVFLTADGCFEFERGALS